MLCSRKSTTNDETHTIVRNTGRGQCPDATPNDGFSLLNKASLQAESLFLASA
ncbi:MAG: hypothetical protein LBR10_12820 [Prevotellaceae bacterium]|nr:hypothetical protein [Prevotellaceae bacterium]